MGSHHQLYKESLAVISLERLTVWSSSDINKEEVYFAGNLRYPMAHTFVLALLQKLCHVFVFLFYTAYIVYHLHQKPLYSCQQYISKYVSTMLPCKWSFNLLNKSSYLILLVCCSFIYLHARVYWNSNQLNSLMQFLSIKDLLTFF